MTREVRENQGRYAERDVRQWVVVGLLAHPDLPELIAGGLADDLPEMLSQRVSNRVSWEVESVRYPSRRCCPVGDREGLLMGDATDVLCTVWAFSTRPRRLPGCSTS